MTKTNGASNDSSPGMVVFPFLAHYLPTKMYHQQSSLLPLCSNEETIRTGLNDIVAAERNYILSNLPESYRKLFGTYGSDTFYCPDTQRWYRRFLRIMNPYELPPGPVRENWMKYYITALQQNNNNTTTTTTTNNKLKELPYICLWFKNKYFPNDEYTIHQLEDFQKNNETTNIHSDNEFHIVDDLEWMVNQLLRELQKNRRDDNNCNNNHPDNSKDHYSNDQYNDDSLLKLSESSDKLQTVKIDVERLHTLARGTHISIFSNQDDIYYDGVVVDHHMPACVTKIQFYDGHSEWITLCDQPYKILEVPQDNDNDNDNDDDVEDTEGMTVTNKERFESNKNKRKQNKNKNDKTIEPTTKKVRKSPPSDGMPEPTTAKKKKKISSSINSHDQKKNSTSSPTTTSSTSKESKTKEKEKAITTMNRINKNTTSKTSTSPLTNTKPIKPKDKTTIRNNTSRDSTTTTYISRKSSNPSLTITKPKPKEKATTAATTTTTFPNASPTSKKSKRKEIVTTRLNTIATKTSSSNATVNAIKRKEKIAAIQRIVLQQPDILPNNCIH